MANKDNLVKKGFEVFTRMFMKYDVIGKRPLEIGGGITMNTSGVHTIEAIGKGYANTVTSLSDYFMITKGAVSQVIAKLHQDGYIRKIKGDNKIVLLELTNSGKRALRSHEKYNVSFVKKMQVIENKYSDKELAYFLYILTDVDAIFGEFIEDVK